MADNETIKHLDVTKNYLRYFFIYGFYARRDFARLGALRSYDNERQRIEVWYGDNLKSRMDGKEKIYSIDAERSVAHNPFHEAFKAKSVTAKSFLVHFLVLDALSDYSYASFNAILDRIIDNENVDFDKLADESTIRKTINKLVGMGLVETKKSDKKALLYRISRAEFDMARYSDAIDFFSEADELGVIGSFIADRMPMECDKYIYRHRYLQHALDSELLFYLFEAIREKRSIEIVYFKDKDTEKKVEIVPLKLFVSAQMGRRFIAGWSFKEKNYVMLRLDRVNTIEIGKEFVGFCEILNGFNERRKHMWGVATGSKNTRLTSVEIVFSFDESMNYLADRIKREKRCGEVFETGINELTFRAEVYDAREMLPWVRTYIGNIVRIKTSNNELERMLLENLKAMQGFYEDKIGE